MFLGYEDLYASLTHNPSVPEDYWLTLDPFDPSILQPASFELGVGTSFARWKHHGRVITQTAPKRLADIDENDFDVHRGLAPGDSIQIEPGEHMILAVDRYVWVPRGLILRVEGKSSVGRKGQLIHMAGFVDPGFEGVLMLEPINLAPFPVIYTVGEPICQVSVARLLHVTEHKYGTAELGSKYQGQRIAQPPKRSTTTFAGSPV